MTAAQWLTLTVVLLCLALLAGLAWFEASEDRQEDEEQQ